MQPCWVMSSARAHVLLLAGGSGSRFGSPIPKQIQTLGDLPLFAHSLLTFYQWEQTEQVVISARPDLVSQTELSAGAALERAAGKRRGRPLRVRVVAGGLSRHASAVAAATAVLQDAKPDDLVLFHDAARPFVSQGELLRLARCFSQEDCDVASLAGPIQDTVVRGHAPGGLEGVLDRSELLSVKTPQAMRAANLLSFVRTPESPQFTDLLTWAHARDMRCALALSDADNHKLTLAAELPIFEAIAARRAADAGQA